MKLKVLGSGNIFSKYNSASYLVDDNILIDVPNGTCKILKNIGVELNNIKHIMITHFHGDHYLDMPFVLLNKIFDESDISNIYCDQTGENKIYNITKLAFPNKVDKIEKYFKYVNNERFNINSYKIEKIELQHEEGIQAYGYIFSKDDKYIGFTGDTGFCQNVEKMASKCSHLIIDCNSIIGKKSHMGIDNVKKLAMKFQKCTFYTTHMDDTTRRDLRALEMKNIVVLKDNDEFEF